MAYIQPEIILENTGEFINAKIFEEISKNVKRGTLVGIEIAEDIGYTLKCQFENEKQLIKFQPEKEKINSA